MNDAQNAVGFITTCLKINKKVPLVIVDYIIIEIYYHLIILNFRLTLKKSLVLLSWFLEMIKIKKNKKVYKINLT